MKKRVKSTFNPKQSKILKYIHDNIYSEQRNWLCLVMGKVGSGKSFSALRIAELMDKNFNIDRVVFNEDDFMNLVRSNLPKGSFIVADEIGSWLPAREYMTMTNRLLSYVLQTFRFKQLGILWTTPVSRFVDKNLRSMADATLETLKVYRSKQEVECKFKNYEINPITGKEYYKFPVVLRPDGSHITITRVFISRPSPELEKAYLKKKKEHMDKFYDKIHQTLKYLDKTGKKYLGKTIEEGKLVKCKKCGYMWNSVAMRPRCQRCLSSKVVAVGENA